MERKLINKHKDFYIKTNKDLEKVVDLVKQRKVVALDTEFIRRNTYYPILSLIQVGLKDENNQKESFIIDCLSGIDLTEMFNIIADENIVKVLHSSLQDLQIFFYESKLFPKNIFDTQIMSNFCGPNFNIGYSNLVYKMFNHKLNKGQQNSDWRRRPLSKEQLEYALLDVFFLLEIYESFLEKLQENQRLSWFLEDMDNFITKALTTDEQSLYRGLSFRDKPAREVGQMKRLAVLREKWARIIDVPRRHLLSDEDIEKIVLDHNFQPDLKPEIMAEINEILISDIKHEIKMPKLYLDEERKNNLNEAKKLVQKIAVKNGFVEQFLITNIDLRKIICDKSSLDKIVSGWRYHVFGEELKQFIYSL